MILGRSPYSTDNPYDLLGIRQDADRKEVNRAYREAMKTIRMQDERFQKVQQAKEALTKPAKRLLVDLTIPARTGDLAAVLAEAKPIEVAAEVGDDPALLYLLSDLYSPRFAAELPPPEFLSPSTDLPEFLGGDPVAARLKEVGP